MSYLVAWLVAFVATAILAFLVYYPLRRRKLLALLLIALGCFWALWPMNFEEGHLAPLFVVFVFWTFLEPEVDPTPAIVVGLIGSMGIVVAYVALLLIRRAFDRPKRQNIGELGSPRRAGDRR
ncbi:MAG: hypothetical protein OXG08_09940 [Gammaproteobacteria bacterium]|nr:hypothetical protein [Gammaproteobacteria bacterium]